MVDRKRLPVGITSIAVVGLCAALAAGCNKPDDTGAGNSSGAPPGPGAPGGMGGPGGRMGGPGGPMGGPGGRMGGPGGRMGGPGGMMGGRGAPVAADASGEDIYKAKCAFCHGANGQGARGPALTASGGKSSDDLHKIIHDGKDGGRMPAFGSQLSDAQ